MSTRAGMWRALALGACLVHVGVTGCDDGGTIKMRVVGEMTVDPQRVPANGRPAAEVAVHVYQDGASGVPVQGMQVEVVSSRNLGGQVVDEIEQPQAPTDPEGRAVAFIGSSTPGEDIGLVVRVDGAPLCESYQGDACIQVQKMIEFYLYCEGGLTACDGECVDTSSDVDNCGDCDVVCAFDHASAACEGGRCTMGACEDGWGDCNDDSADGCESDLLSDRFNCGTCGNVCEGGWECLGGVCQECEDQDGDGHGDMACGGDDCNDLDASIHPGAPELCDGIDNNCDERVDENPEASESCSDGQQCTQDVCERGVGCVHLPLHGDPCEDGDDCTMQDRCANGTCTGVPTDADGDGYVWDACGGRDCDDQDAEINPGQSEVGDACSDGHDNDCDGLTDAQDSTCQGCTTDASCNDGNRCNGQEVCVDSRCEAGTALVCDDANPCTDDECNPLTGCVFTPNAAVCDDGDDCTMSDTCHQGACHGLPQDGDGDGYVPVSCGGQDCNDVDPDIHPGVFEAGADCTDGVDNDCDGLTDGDDPGCAACSVDADCLDDNFCNGLETCVGGQCQAGTPLDCDDGDPCTDDACDMATGCVHAFNQAPCDDGDACTMQDACASGTCIGTPMDEDGDGYVAAACGGDDCDDANPGVSPGVFEGGPGTCGDGLDNDCDGLVDDEEPVCGIECTQDTDCSDGNICSGYETCIDGVCLAGIPLDCDDQNVCTDDRCDPVSGCVRTANTNPCDDGDPCTTNDACSDRVCLGGGQLACDDDNICTDDLCDPDAGGCVHLPNDYDGDGDGFVADFCGGVDCDDSRDDIYPGAGEAPPGSVACTDGLDNDCDGRIDLDDPTCRQCTDDSECDDGLYCNGVETCDVVQGCQDGTPVVCDDGVSCTLDSCDEASQGCLFTPDHTACDDGEVCTDNICDPAQGCVYPDNNAICDDGIACTAGDACAGGVCSGTPDHALCDDADICTDDVCDPAQGGCVYQPSNHDGDGDGYVAAACGGDDCDDADPDVNPGATEGPVGDAVCTDGIDNDCDDLVDVEDSGCRACDTDDDCDDGLVCNGAETCDPATGCQAGIPLDCDDDLACTVDTCEEAAGGCVNTPDPGLCDDGNPCTDNVCDPENGLPADGGCVYPNNTAACEDGISCTVNDVCVDGACQGTPSHSQCNDTNPCTDDVCDPAQGGCVNTNNTAACDDGIACTVDDVCADGACAGTPDAGACNDTNPCTDDVCDPAQGGCVNTNNAAACDDGIDCTVGDVCADGACAGTPDAAQCDDANVCTDDACDPAQGGCVYTNNSDSCDDGIGCTVNDTCADGSCQGTVSHAQCDDANVCTDDACDPAQGGCVYVDNTASCDDGDACTTNDSCADGTCVGGAAPDCDDGNVCTDDSCDPSTGCVNANNTAACDDGDECTVDDVCADGACTSGPLRDGDSDGYVDHLCGGTDCDDANELVNPGMTEGPYGDAVCADSIDNDCDSATDMNDTGCNECSVASDCDDGNACNGEEDCVSGACVSGTALDCDDGNVCTDDSCDPATGCVYTDNTDACNDGNACTTNDTCSGGTCVGGAAPDCNDGNVCTDDSCDPATGCVHTNNTASCSDGDACTTNDTCSGGSCVGGAAPDCDDGNVCTDDSCDPATGCVHTNNTVACSDGDACTTGDVCSGGACNGTGTLDCNDGNVCTNDSCDSASGCVYTNNTASCSDGNACTTNDTCSDGTCVGGAALDCDDGNVCTDDSCNPSSGCEHANNTASCSDGNACTVGDVCSGGSCQPGPLRDTDDDGYVDDACGGLDCDDNDPNINPSMTEGPYGDADCSDGIDNDCDGFTDLAGGDTGCMQCSGPEDCDDNNVCNGTEDCVGGECVSGTALDCDDGNVCTSDSCDPVNGCEYVNNTNACNDGDACTTNDTCSGGVCVGGAALDCDDGNVCTTDGCNPSSGCTHTNNTASCDDGNACTTNDTCDSGTCVGGAAPDCNDGNVCTTDSCDPATGCTYTNNTASCDDGNACTTNDTCDSGACVGGAALDCDDGNVCTTDGCDPATGCTHTNNTASCDDGNACTTNDTCDSGTCVGGTAPDCDDGNVCTDDSCESATGCVHTNNTASCSDGDACTVGDACSGGSCVPGDLRDSDDDGYVDEACGGTDCNDGNSNINPGVVEGPYGNVKCSDGIDNDCDDTTDMNDTGCMECTGPADCDDSNVCNGTEDCVSGECVSGTPLDCDDDNPCTGDSCDTVDGCEYVNNTDPCNDGDACTTGDVCSGGTCGGTGTLDCDDGNVCTDDGCDSATGCTYTNNTASCDDGVACTENDICGGGSCSGTPNEGLCNDSNVCTDDTCHQTQGCQYTNNSDSCDDGVACTVGDTCVDGVCQGTASDTLCDDGNVCTDDDCHPINGCEYTNNTASCNDGVGCTVDDVCSGGDCHGTTSDTLCDDGNVCTDDVCDLLNDCEYSNNNASCNDGVGCTESDVCSGGSCGGSPNNGLCDDTNVCTDDVCDPIDDCQYSYNSNSCDDGIACTLGDTCTDGDCVGSPSNSACNDSNVCTDDTCDPDQGGCVYANNTNPCNDGDPCTHTDTCGGGSCSGGIAYSCDDGDFCTLDTCDGDGTCTYTDNPDPSSDPNFEWVEISCDTLDNDCDGCFDEGCGGDTIVAAEVIPYSDGAGIRRISGNAQMGPVGKVLPNPLVIQLNDGSGSPMPGVLVTFSVVPAGTVCIGLGGTYDPPNGLADFEIPRVCCDEEGTLLAPTQVRTDINGQASVRLRVPYNYGMTVVKAAASSGETTYFFAVAVPELTSSITLPTTETYANANPALGPLAVTKRSSGSSDTYMSNINNYTLAITGLSASTGTVNGTPAAALAASGQLTISGVNFEASGNTVWVGGVQANVTSESASSITVDLPEGLPGAASVIVDDGTETSFSGGSGNVPSVAGAVAHFWRTAPKPVFIFADANARNGSEAKVKLLGKDTCNNPVPIDGASPSLWAEDVDGTTPADAVSVENFDSGTGVARVVHRDTTVKSAYVRGTVAGYTTSDDANTTVSTVANPLSPDDFSGAGLGNADGINDIITRGGDESSSTDAATLNPAMRLNNTPVAYHVDTIDTMCTVGGDPTYACPAGTPITTVYGPVFETEANLSTGQITGDGDLIKVTGGGLCAVGGTGIGVVTGGADGLSSVISVTVSYDPDMADPGSMSVNGFVLPGWIRQDFGNLLQEIEATYSGVILYDEPAMEYRDLVMRLLMQRAMP